MKTENARVITRREFLKGAAMVGGAAVLSAVAAACGPFQGASNVNTGAKKTVRYLTWWMEEGNRGKTWTSMIKEFNDSQKDIEIKPENIPFDDYTTKTIVAAQAGKLDGDLLQATPELAPR